MEIVSGFVFADVIFRRRDTKWLSVYRGTEGVYNRRCRDTMEISEARMSVSTGQL